MRSPERVGRYRLDGVIGAGSFATVHRAVDERLDDVVVVKVLAENHSLNPEVRERFIAEGRALRRVRSPHVVTVHDIGESDRQQPFLVLEHADRGTLADRVALRRADGWQATPDDLLDVARALAAAVEAVHAAQLVHRDLSPGNVLLHSVPAHERDRRGRRGPAALLADDERLVLADLGISKDLAVSSGLTVAGGTEGFRPPEQRRAGPVDARADLWALSALMRWLADGAPVPPPLDRALGRSLADDPADRHPDVAAWRTEVEAALAPPAPAAPAAPGPRRSGTDGPGGPGEPSEPARREHPPIRRRRGSLVLAVVVALLAGLAVGALLWRGDGSAIPARHGDASVAIAGPEDATVGQPITLTAEVEGLAGWVWTLPSGEPVVDAEQVTVTARSPGEAEIVLRARTPDGTDLQTVHELDVSE